MNDGDELEPEQKLSHGGFARLKPPKLVMYEPDVERAYAEYFYQEWDYQNDCPMKGNDETNKAL